MKNTKDKFLAEQIAKKVKEVFDENPDTCSIDIDVNNNIHFKSKNMDIYGGPGCTEMFHQAMKDSINNNTI